MSLEPDMTELLREVIESRLADVHTSIPGRVVSYDASTQTADVEIVIFRADQAETGEVVHEAYPVVPNVPVAWPSGGGYSLQLPLAAGDGVWLVFSEAAVANWRDTGDVSPPGDLDRHDLSYPIAIPGARHKGQALPATTSALLTVPSGGSFAVSTAGGPAKAVAMAEEVNSNFQAIKDLFTAWSPVAQDGGLSLKTAAESLTFDPVDSSSLKAQ